MKIFRILAINPGSTSTKISVYENKKCILEKTLRHPTEDIEKFHNIYLQKDFRKTFILDFLSENKIELESFDAIVGRGGLLNPLVGGTYVVDDKMIKDLKIGVLGEHASNLGGIIAKEIADKINKNAYIVDPVIVDELQDVARISGIPEIERKSIFHALNQKAVARKFCRENNFDYDKINLIVAHMGGGISVGLHSMGKVIDVNNALDGEGPFSPERSGGLPSGQLLKLCYSDKYSQDFLKKRIKGNGGLVAYLGTNDVRDVLELIEKEEKNKKQNQDKNNNAKLILDAMIYQIAKEIGALATVTLGKIEQIILTGGIAYSDFVTKKISEKVNFISPVTIYAGEEEMLALVEGVIWVLNGEEKAKKY
ncbi:MAG: butyrate kinase [Fusobacteriaceae bacterium]